MIVEGPKIPETELARHERKIGNDLIAFFKVLRDDVSELLAQAEKEGWDEERFIGEAMGLLEEKE